jgi:sporulation protein YlmC with PRC-barrel domain
VPADVARGGRHTLSDLLGCTVLDGDGRRLGLVNDVRLGPVPGAAGTVPQLQVEGLIVAGASTGSLLGYDRRPAQGPWLIRALVTRLHRNARYVRWEQVGELRWAERTIVVTGSDPLGLR